MVALVGLLGNTPAQAADTDTCVSTTAGGINFTISKHMSGSQWPVKELIPGTDVSAYRYDYQITGPSPLGIGQLDAIIPACATSYLGGSVSQIYPPGQGDPNVNFGIGVYQYGVARTPPIGGSGPAFISIYTNTGSLSTISMAIKSAKFNHFCGPIVGPECPGFAQYAVVSAKKIITEEGFELCVKSDPYTQCDQLVDCETGEEFPYKTTDQFIFGAIGETTGLTSPLVETSTPGSGCATLILRTSGDHSFYYYSGGRWYTCTVSGTTTTCR
jgi:hypothetical protein